MVNFLKKAKSAFFFSFKKKGAAAARKPQEYHFVEGVLFSLLVKKIAENSSEKVNVLQIGANDGYVVDPVFNFCMNLQKNKTRIAAVEPLPDVYKALKENYCNHPDFAGYNLLVGNDKSGVLYSIKNKYWSSYKGVIGSGISSLDYNHVFKKAQNQLPKKITKNIKIEDLIKKEVVNCLTLTEIIKSWGYYPDFIQIDVEGLDDEVLYSLNFDEFLPQVLAFETSLLSEEKKDKLFSFLSEHGYLITQATADDHCAFLKQ